MNIRKIGCFIEPEGQLSDYILQLKDAVPQNFEGPFTYLNHPPHLTLFTLNVLQDQMNHLMQQAANQLKEFQAFGIETKKFHVFYDDKLTNGHTITCKVNKSRRLAELQLKLIANAQNFRDKTTKITGNTAKNIFSTNYLNYGFPFIGSIWKPHFTISSVGTTQNNLTAINKFTAHHRCYYKQDIKKISYWLIEGDEHKKIEEVTLA